MRVERITLHVDGGVHQIELFDVAGQLLGVLRPALQLLHLFELPRQQSSPG